MESGKFLLHIKTHIVNCKDFILILSKNTFMSRNEGIDYVLEEIKLALEFEKNIIPLKNGRLPFQHKKYYQMK